MNALAIHGEENFIEGVKKLYCSIRDNCTADYTSYLVSRTIDSFSDCTIIKPMTPRGDTFKPRLSDCFAWIEALKLPHDRIVVMDADQLVIGDIDELFTLSGWNVCPDPNNKFSGGLYVIHAPYNIRVGWYNWIVRLIPTYKWRAGDISLLSYWSQFSGVKFNMLDRKYQHMKFYGTNGIEDARIIHFHGLPKPWDGVDNKFADLFNIWINYTC